SDGKAYACSAGDLGSIPGYSTEGMRGNFGRCPFSFFLGIILFQKLNLLKPMSIESVMPSNHLILCHPLLLPPSIFPSTRELRLCASPAFPQCPGVWKPVDGPLSCCCKWVDGGFTNSLPVLPAGRTVTVSPFSGRLDVSPQDKGRLHFCVSITNQDVLLSVANLVRLSQALFPPSRRTMESLYQRGFEDASRFLRKESWFE
ncbi:hypothetical protein FD754_018622, partial [Muntiacus muntjak]